MKGKVEELRLARKKGKFIYFIAVIDQMLGEEKLELFVYLWAIKSLKDIKESLL
jgi:hypothetical protein